MFYKILEKFVANYSLRHWSVSLLFTFVLTFESLEVTLRTTRFKIQKFCVLVTLHLCAL